MDDDASRASTGARRNPETETAVLDAALALIEEEGYARLTMEAVARRARAGKATLYRWWPSKAHLLLSLYTRVKDTLPEPDTGTLKADLVIYVGAMLDNWRSTTMGQVLRHLIAEAQSDPQVLQALARERAERWHHMDRIVERAAARGELARTMSVGRAERRIIATCWYLLLNDQLPHSAEDVHLLIDDLAGPMLS